MMLGMGDLLRSWKARKWHTYATFVRFYLSQTCTHACVLLFSMSADIFKNKRFARDVQTKRAFPPPYPPPFCRWMMRGMGDLFRSWKARKWHTYATFVRFCICNGASMAKFRVFNDILLHLENKRFVRDVETKRVFRPHVLFACFDR